MRIKDFYGAGGFATFLCEAQAAREPGLEGQVVFLSLGRIDQQV